MSRRISSTAMPGDVRLWVLRGASSLWPPLLYQRFDSLLFPEGDVYLFDYVYCTRDAMTCQCSGRMCQGAGMPAWPLSPRFTRPLLRFWLQCRAFLDHAQRLGDGAVELWINIVREVLGCDIDLDIGVGAVVFYVPAYIFEPESVLRLRGTRAIDECVLGADTDHTAPGAFADQGTQAH